MRWTRVLVLACFLVVAAACASGTCQSKLDPKLDPDGKMERVVGKAFRGTDGLVAQKATEELKASFPAEKAIPFLVACATNEKETVNFRTSCLLGVQAFRQPDGLIPMDGGMEDRLIHWLKEEESLYLRNVIGGTLVRTNGGLDKLLKETGKDSTPDVRRTVAYNLRWFSEKNPRWDKTTDSLRKLIKDPDSTVSVEAAITLAWRAQFDEGVMPAVVGALTSEDDELRGNAASCLAELFRIAENKQAPQREAINKALDDKCCRLIVAAAINQSPVAGTKVVKLVGKMGTKALPHVEKWVKENVSKLPDDHRGARAEIELKMRNAVLCLGFMGKYSPADLHKPILETLEPIKNGKNQWVGQEAGTTEENVKGNVCTPPYCAG